MSSKLDTMKVSKYIMKTTFKNTLFLALAMALIGMLFSITECFIVMYETGLNLMTQEAHQRFAIGYMLFVSFGIMAFVSQIALLKLTNKKEVK
tara:strand:- start:2534 stop:2812 length:279 start_codon:yes stop_codon:yes gene_type:complete